VKTPEYAQYISEEGRDLKTETAMFRFIWEGLMQKNESFLEHMSDELPGWEDDAPMMFMLMDNFFKSIQRVNFLALITGEKQTYAMDLLRTVLDKDEYTMELLNPKLVKWESDRVAIIDLILLRMGVAEFLYFPTIPTKVTINEYIDLAKMYSTPQSGQFVNGVLDNLLKELEKDGKIRKAERGMKS
jgi:N utilization substance protein B